MTMNDKSKSTARSQRREKKKKKLSPHLLRLIPIKCERVSDLDFA